MGCNKITFNLEYSHKKGSPNLGRIHIRCTQNRMHKRLSTGISIAPKFWDKVHYKIKPSHHQSSDLNNLIHEKIRKLTVAYTNLLSESDEVYLDDLFGRVSVETVTNFFEFAYSTKMAEIKSRKKLGTYRRYDAVFNKLKKYAGKNLKLNQINYAFLQKYILHLKTKLRNNDDTISANLSVIRTIISEAIKHEMYKGNSPFIQLKMKYTGNSSAKLSAEELKRIFTYPLPNFVSFNLARDFFIACFLAEGTRAGDMIAMKKGKYSEQ